MIKSRFLILRNMIPYGIVRKSGFLISLLLLFFPVNAIASENSPSDHSANSAQIIQENIEESSLSVIHVGEGTFVYGMEHMSRNQKPKHIGDKKNPQPTAKKIKKHALVKKNLTKAEPKPVNKLPESDNRISTHHSTDSFKLSKQQFASGTLTNILSKAAILTKVSNFHIIFSYNTNSSYIPYLLLKGGWPDSVFYTRPPPFIQS